MLLRKRPSSSIVEWEKNTGLGFVAVTKCEKGIRHLTWIHILYQLLARQSLSPQNCIIHHGFTAETKYMAQKVTYRFNKEI